MSARQVDTNGWVEIKGNPISKAGVFQYLGKSLDLPGVEPDKIYSVYCPESELSDPETIESFKLLPWIEDHEWLGSDQGTAVEDKTIHGVTGEDIYFEAPYLKGNLKLYSRELADKIENEKKELSLGYLCLHILEKGTYNGEPYEIVQRKIRGNHLASVNTGRKGHEVRVLDQKDNLSEVPLMDDEKKIGSEDLVPKLIGLLEKVCAGFADRTAVADKDEPEMKEMETKRDEDESEKEDVKKEKIEDESEKDDSKTMDAADALVKSVFSQISRKEALVRRASKIIGTFDASDMDLNGVTRYVMKELRLSCPRGHEASTLAGYFAAASINRQSEQTRVMDEGVKSSQIQKFIHGEC